MSTTRKTTAKPVREAEPVQEAKHSDASVPKRRTPTEVDIHQYVPVCNGFQGALVYVSKRTGEVFEWNAFGDEQDMELQELKNAKSSDKAFFQNNWFMFDEDHQWVIDWLGVGVYYKNALKLDSFDDIFTKDPDEVARIVDGLSDGQKSTLAYRARQLIEQNAIDSNRVIAALETGLGVPLVER